MAGLLQPLADLAFQYGYLGVFVASLAGSVIPFLPVPYLIVVVLLSGSLDPITLGVVAGLGGAIGKATSYFLGRSGYLASGPGTKRRLEFLGRFTRKYGALGVFIFAVTPLPDDIYLVPMGMVKFPFWRFMLATVLGKVILSTAVAYFGRGYFQLARFYIGTDDVATAAVVVVLTVVLTALLARADGELAYADYQGGGARAILADLRGVLRLRRAEPSTSP
jgi:membrane protein YqaA with SNARE-associated domain